MKPKPGRAAQIVEGNTLQGDSGPLTVLDVIPLGKRLLQVVFTNKAAWELDPTDDVIFLKNQP